MKTIQEMNAAELKNEILNAVAAYNEKYLEEHPTDWDCCGFAWISIGSGRKAAALKFLESIGLFNIDKSTRWGKVVHMVNINQEVKTVPHQSLTYREDLYRTILKVLLQRSEIQQLQINVDSMMD